MSWLFKKQLEFIPDKYILNRVKHDMDFIGVNYYMRMLVKASFSHPANWALKNTGQDILNDMGWGIYPDGIYNVTQKLNRYNLPLIVTENGIPDALDTKRAKFISDHIEALFRSHKDGADIRGYFYWSLLDNYEWSEGFWPKFGLASVDRRTMERTLKPSAQEYSKLIKEYS